MTDVAANAPNASTDSQTLRVAAVVVDMSSLRPVSGYLEKWRHLDALVFEVPLPFPLNLRRNRWISRMFELCGVLHFHVETEGPALGGEPLRQPFLLALDELLTAEIVKFHARRGACTWTDSG
jgi:hypothetical protein